MKVELEFGELNNENSFYLYVGSTSNTRRRLLEHHYKINKTRRYSKQIKKIEFTSLFMTDETGRFYWENFYVELFKHWGFTLKNKMKINPNNNKYSLKIQ